MTRLRLATLALLAAPLALAADTKPPAMDAAQATNLKDAAWVAPKPPEIPKGVMTSLVSQDPGGGSMAYAKYPGGYAFPKHFHSATEYTTVLSGKVEFVVDGKTHSLEPGGYVVIPPKAQHELHCAAGAECVVLTRRAGPTDYNWVK